MMTYSSTKRGDFICQQQYTIGHTLLSFDVDGVLGQRAPTGFTQAHAHAKLHPLTLLWHRVTGR
jgi:hypothetical protein